MKEKCSICGNDTYDTFAFKGGFICEDCLRFVKDSFGLDTYVRRSK